MAVWVEGIEVSEQAVLMGGACLSRPGGVIPRACGVSSTLRFSIQSLRPLEYWIPASAGMTTECDFAISRHVLSEVCIFVCPPSKTEGAGKTGCALHPRSRVHLRTKNAHTSIQVQRRASGLPCAMALRLTSSSCVRKICQNVRTGGSDQPPVAGSDPVRAQRPRACRGARDRSGVFLNPNSCTGFEPEPSKEGSG